MITNSSQIGNTWSIPPNESKLNLKFSSDSSWFESNLSLMTHDRPDNWRTRPNTVVFMNLTQEKLKDLICLSTGIQTNVVKMKLNTKIRKKFPRLEKSSLKYGHRNMFSFGARNIFKYCLLYVIDRDCSQSAQKYTFHFLCWGERKTRIS